MHVGTRDIFIWVKICKYDSALYLFSSLLLFSRYIKSAPDYLADEWEIYNQDIEAYFAIRLWDFELFSEKAELEEYQIIFHTIELFYN